MRRGALGIDLALIVVFVAIGRTSHDHGVSLSGMASTCWPFLVGLIAAWGLVLATKRDPLSLGSGALIVAITVAVAMVLRVVSGQGTAVAFIIVALCFLGLFLVGWRGLRLFVVARAKRRGEKRPEQV